MQKYAQSQKFNKKSTWIKITLFFISISIVVGYRTTNVSNSVLKIHDQLLPETHSIPISKYTLVDPIEINNAGDWANYSFITGSGTLDEPYIIEGVEIAGTNAYYIGHPEHYGIRIDDYFAVVVITKCYIHDLQVGIKFTGSYQNITQRIEGNIIERCGLGIDLFDTNAIISDNHISECHSYETSLLYLIYTTWAYRVRDFGGVGICISASMSVNITSNNISNCEIGAALKAPCIFTDNRLTKCGILLHYWELDHYIIENNFVNDLPLGFYTYKNYDQTAGQSLILDGNIQQYGQLFVFSLTNVIIKNMFIQDTTLGYEIEQNHNLTLSNCTVNNCLFGMFINHCAVSDEDDAEIVQIEKIHINNCFIGFQLTSNKSQVERNNNDVSIEIVEFTNNNYDIFLVDYPVSWDSMAVPINTTIYFDYRYEHRYQILYNKTLSMYVGCAMSMFYKDLCSITLHLNDLGQYHILIEIQAIENIWEVMCDDTIDVVRVEPNITPLPSDEFLITAFSELWFSILIGVNLIYAILLSKRRKKFNQRI